MLHVVRDSSLYLSTATDLGASQTSKRQHFFASTMQNIQYLYRLMRIVALLRRSRHRDSSPDRVTTVALSR